MILLLLGLLVFAGTIFAVVKRYNTTIVLFVSGIALWAIAIIFDAHYYTLTDFKSSGLAALDIFVIFEDLIKSSIGGVGLIIMAAGGFSQYMNTIGASSAFVQVGAKPLLYIKSPYMLIALAVVFAQIMSIFIPSATGLGMLLLVTLFPLLRKLKVSAPSAAAAIASTACLELGPASGSTNVGAELANMTSMEYFVNYQLVTAVPAVIVIAVLYFVTSIYFDKKENVQAMEVEEAPTAALSKDPEEKKLPSLYGLLPILPLLLLLIFSDYIVASVQLDVIAAMFVAFFIAMLCELIRTRNITKTFEQATSFFTGMADMLKNVVMLLIAAQFFASGLQGVGLSYHLIQSADTIGFGMLGMTIVLVLIVGILTMVSGSGSAAFLSFSGLAPDIANKMHEPVVQMLVPMQAASATFRGMSPVAGIVIAVAGGTGVDPFTVVKRTAIPMIGGTITTIIVSFLL